MNPCKAFLFRLLCAVVGCHAATATDLSKPESKSELLNLRVETPPGQVANDPSSENFDELVLCGAVLLAIGAACGVYELCCRQKCRSKVSGSMLSTGNELVIRRTINFHEDLLSDTELQRLWSCWQCDFANYAHKTRCALCGCTKPELSEKSDITSNNSCQGTLDTSSRGSVSLWAALSPDAAQAMSPTMHIPLFTPSAVSAAPSSPFSAYCPVVTPTLGPSFTPSSRLRRKQWQAELNDQNQLVWSPSTACSGLEETTMNELITATAFVSRVTVEQTGPDAKLAIVPADQALVSPPDHFTVSASQTDECLGNSTSNSMDSMGIMQLRSRSFPEKHRWFLHQTSAILRDQDVQNNNTTLGTPRDHSSLKTAVSSLSHASKAQLQRPLHVKFENEPGVDAGGLLREWFGLVAAEFLHERHGLFKVMHTTNHEMCSPRERKAVGALAYAINSNASLAVEDHLSFYRAFGRFVGKALLESHLVPLPMTDVIFKHILGEPVSFADLVELDGNLARSLQIMWEEPSQTSDSAAHVSSDDVEEDAYGLDFSVFHTALGTVDLKANGRSIRVTNHNRREYVTLFVQWHLARSETRELASIVQGVHDVLPAYLLAPFDSAELRLLLCGLPVVDLKDWEASTAVAGNVSSAKAKRLTRWFWRVLANMSSDDRERILQFATGSCRVPVHGFKALTTSDGRLCPFTLHWQPITECPAPRAHTCFNRLDLPIYQNEQELADALHLVAQMEVTGFSIA